MRCYHRLQFIAKLLSESKELDGMKLCYGIYMPLGKPETMMFLNHLQERFQQTKADERGQSRAISRQFFAKKITATTLP